MNGSARQKFNLNSHELQERLPKSLLRRFDRCFASPSKATKPSPVQLALVDIAPFACSMEVMRLAGGHDGLIVAEIHTAGEASVKAAPSKRRASPSRAAKPAALRTDPATRHSAPELTPDEQNSLKAIARKVRRLCALKRSRPLDASGDGPPIADTKAKPVKQVPVTRSADEFGLRILSAFDLVLYFDEDSNVIASDGRTRLGWRKGDLQGRSLQDVLASSSEASTLRRMLGKLRNHASSPIRDALRVRDKADQAVPCRALLGRMPDHGARFFLALISLDVPLRMRKSTAADFASRAERLAA